MLCGQYHGCFTVLQRPPRNKIQATKHQITRNIWLVVYVVKRRSNHDIAVVIS